MRRLITAQMVAGLAILVTIGPATAHIGGGAFILVPADHVLPGATFEVIAADMGMDATVSFRIEHDTLVVPLDAATAGPDGHFQTTLSLPADFPIGYAQLIARADDGSEASTWLLVGERTAATPPPPATVAWWTDPSVLVLLVLLIGAAGVVGYLVLRPRRTRIAAVRATSRTAPRQRKRDRRSGP